VVVSVYDENRLAASASGSVVVPPRY
jgi:hypothetical protein